MNSPAANGPAAPVREPAAKVKPKAATRISRFPYQFHFAISPAMQRSLERLTGHNSLWDSAQIGRLSLHSWLLQNDMQYHEEVTGTRQ
jgi:hypothetical protein